MEDFAKTRYELLKPLFDTALEGLDRIGESTLEKRKLFEWNEYMSQIWGLVKDNLIFVKGGGDGWTDLVRTTRPRPYCS